MKALRSLTKAILPPGTGVGPRLYTPQLGSGVFDQSAAPVLGVNFCSVNCTTLRVGT
ncbi:hypothetical protein D3C83_198980 [compost metagenome]